MPVKYNNNSKNNSATPEHSELKQNFANKRSLSLSNLLNRKKKEELDADDQFFEMLSTLFTDNSATKEASEPVRLSHKNKYSKHAHSSPQLNTSPKPKRRDKMRKARSLPRQQATKYSTKRRNTKSDASLILSSRYELIESTGKSNFPENKRLRYEKILHRLNKNDQSMSSHENFNQFMLLSADELFSTHFYQINALLNAYINHCLAYVLDYRNITPGDYDQLKQDIAQWIYHFNTEFINLIDEEQIYDLMSDTINKIRIDIDSAVQALQKQHYLLRDDVASKLFQAVVKHSPTLSTDNGLRHEEFYSANPEQLCELIFREIETLAKQALDVLTLSNQRAAITTKNHMNIRAASHEVLHRTAKSVHLDTLALDETSFYMPAIKLKKLLGELVQDLEENVLLSPDVCIADNSRQHCYMNKIFISRLCLALEKAKIYNTQSIASPTNKSNDHAMQAEIRLINHDLIKTEFDKIIDEMLEDEAHALLTHPVYALHQAS